MNSTVIVTILGCRGSVPVSGERFNRYGGATSCVLIRSEKNLAVLDAGTGLLKLDSHLHKEQNIPLFLTHCHVDHILGLPLCPPALNCGYQFRIYGAPQGGLDIAAQLDALMSPPLWPVSLNQLPAHFSFHSTAPHLAVSPSTG